MTNLRSVDHDERADPYAPPAAGPGEAALPDFEGEGVEFAKFKLTSTTNLEAPDAPVRIDQIVRLFVEGRVTRIDHVVDKESGRLKRVQTISVVDCIQLPWDFDPGVLDG